ncbi:MAG: hypothetical protein WAR80_10815, partial [Ferruginibacter sp.]
MNKIFMLVIMLCIGSQIVCAQGLAINNTAASPDPSALLDVTSNAKGILIPRMNTATVLSISNPAKGLLVYDTAQNLLMVNMGTPALPNWQTIAYNSGWNLTGNAGTNTATHFLGTTDPSSVNFRMNNKRSGLIDSVTLNTALGYRALELSSAGTFNTAFGFKSLLANTTGTGNAAQGTNTLMNNTSGGYNTAIGLNALQLNTTGTNNTATGAAALQN